jgi:hypothetical protein
VARQRAYCARLFPNWIPVLSTLNNVASLTTVDAPVRFTGGKAAAPRTVGPISLITQSGPEIGPKCRSKFRNEKTRCSNEQRRCTRPKDTQCILTNLI